MHNSLLKLLISACALNFSTLLAKEIDQSFSRSFSSDYLDSDDLPPIASDGSALFMYVNNSGLKDKQIFLQIVGVNPQTGIQCFIKYDRQGNPHYFDVHEKIDSQDYAFALSDFPLSAQNTRFLYLPQLDGARIYTSINKKLTFLVMENELGEWTINAPNPLNPNDPNQNILWDKTEFAVNPFAVFINPTAVDNFSLPLYCEETGIDGSTQLGGILVDRAQVFKDLKNAFQKAGEPWTLLLSKTSGLVYSPMYAAATGLISENLLVETQWLSTFKNFYSVIPLLIDTEESLPISRGGGIWKGKVERISNTITFNRIVDVYHPPIPSSTISIPTKLSEILAGSGPSWQIAEGDLVQQIFARNLACAIDTNTLSSSLPLSQKYFKDQAQQFYQYNRSLPKKLQFIDYYSKVLHSYGNHQIYTLPYDDELAQSGAASYTPQNYAGGKIILGPLKKA